MGGFMERTVRWLRRIIAPSGRHRAGRLPPVRFAHSVPREQHMPLRTAVAPAVRAWREPLDSAATRLVRPYLTACECEEQARIRRLWWDIHRCAACGVDLDGRGIQACLGAGS